MTSKLRSLFHRLRNRQQVEKDLDKEVQSYFDTIVERHIARGLTRDEATRAARLAAEGPEQVKERVRDIRTGAKLEIVFRDIQYAIRLLRKSPVFTTIAVLTLALGIGANTAIFSLINAVMLRMLPVNHPEQLVMLTDPIVSGAVVDTTEGGKRHRMSYPEFEQLRANNKVFSGVFAAQNEVKNLDTFPGDGTSSQPKILRGQLVSGEFFQVLGVQPFLGRAFTPDEDKVPGANPVAVVSYDCWQREFGGTENFIGSTIRVGSAVFRVLGVTPPGFRGILIGSSTDIWFPITMQQQVLPGRNYLVPRDTLWVHIVGRLLPQVSHDTAQAGINVTFQQTLQSWAAALPSEKVRRNFLDQKIILHPAGRGASELRGAFSGPLILLMAMVGVVLLIACANIANLMLARANGRRREMGVRLALGASRGRLIRQLLTESLIVAVAGGILGIFLADFGSRLLVILVASGFGDLALEIPRDHRVLLFTSTISLLTGILFGLFPAVRITRLDVNRTLAVYARGAVGGRGNVQTGRILAVAQVALSMVLLMGAALFVRSLNNMITENLGYNRDQILMVRIDPLAAGYKGANATALYGTIRERLRSIPGIRNVTFSNTGLVGGDSGDRLSIEGSPITDPEKLASRWTEIGPDYFTTLGIPLLQGREINAEDVARGTPICVINAAFAREFFQNVNPIGKHITDEYPTTRETFEIVGIVADSKEHGPREKNNSRFYANLAHPIGEVSGVTFLINGSGNPGSAVRQYIRQIDPNLPIMNLRTVNEQLGRRLVIERLIAQLAAFFGTVALIMAAIGLYGVMSYSISVRTSEIGIRMALGASKNNVLKMVLKETLRTVAIGIAIGLPCALVLAKLIASHLYGLSVTDPTAIAGATLILLSAAALAGYLPARRASRIDPMLSLRCD